MLVRQEARALASVQPGLLVRLPATQQVRPSERQEVSVPLLRSEFRLRSPFLAPPVLRPAAAWRSGRLWDRGLGARGQRERQLP